MIPTVKGFSVINEAEAYNFLELSYFFYDPVDVGNLVSGSSAFAKSSLYLWKFLVHILLKPSFRDFEHNFAGLWNEHTCMVVWMSFGIAFLWDLSGNWLFQSCGLWLGFQICCHTECSTFTACSLRILNSLSWNSITTDNIQPPSPP